MMKDSLPGGLLHVEELHPLPVENPDFAYAMTCRFLLWDASGRGCHAKIFLPCCAPGEIMSRGILSASVVKKMVRSSENIDHVLASPGFGIPVNRIW